MDTSLLVGDNYPDMVTGGMLQIVGNGSWNNYAYRPGTGSDGEVIRFAFKTTDVSTSTPLYLQSGIFNTSTYRRWGVYVTGGVLQREYYQGTARSLKNLFSVSANTWYEVLLRLNGTGGFQVVAWKRGDPAVWGADSMQFASGWEGLSWTYVAQAYNGTLQVDDYQEQAGSAIGQRTGMVDGSGSTAWAYDGAGRMVKETRAITGQGSFVTQWGYFNTGQMAWMQYPGGNAGQAGEKLTYSYYPQGAPKTLWSDLGTPANTADDYYYLQQAGYDAAGRTVRLWLGGTYLANLPTVQNGYAYFDWSTPNGGGRLKQITAGTVNDANSLLDLRYYSGTDTPAYDALGNLLNIYRYDTSDVLLETQTFGYDLLNRLTSALATGSAGYSESYSYDPGTGSLASKTGVGTYTYHAPRQGTCATGTNATIPHAAQSAGANAYTYDCNGNMLSRPGQALSFDAENRLVEVNRTVKPIRTEASFTYDGDGTRVKSVVGTTTTVFIGEYLEWTGSTSTLKLHYYAGGRRIALRSAGTLLWLTGDHLGSTTVTADASGGSATTQLYKAWGEVRTGLLNALATRYTFTGQAAEDSLGLLYYHARWYDPYLNQWTQPDTIIPDPYNPLDWNRYSYVRYNPLKYVDPDGHRPDDGCRTEGCSLKEGEEYREYIYNVVYGGVDRQRNSEIVETVLYGGIEIIASLACEPADWAFTLGDGFQWYDSVGLLPIIPGTVGSKVVRYTDNVLSNLPLQNHHILSNINTRWTPLFEEIVNKYDGLDLNGKWNQIELPHQGKHATEYHQWALNMLRGIDEIANGNTQVFTTLFNERILQPLLENPLMLRKKWWK